MGVPLTPAIRWCSFRALHLCQPPLRAAPYELRTGIGVLWEGAPQKIWDAPFLSPHRSLRRRFPAWTTFRVIHTWIFRGKRGRNQIQSWRPGELGWNPTCTMPWFSLCAWGGQWEGPQCIGGLQGWSHRAWRSWQNVDHMGTQHRGQNQAGISPGLNLGGWWGQAGALTVSLGTVSPDCPAPSFPGGPHGDPWEASGEWGHCGFPGPGEQEAGVGWGAGGRSRTNGLPVPADLPPGTQINCLGARPHR